MGDSAWSNPPLVHAPRPAAASRVIFLSTKWQYDQDNGNVKMYDYLLGNSECSTRHTRRCVAAGGRPWPNLYIESHQSRYGSVERAMVGRGTGEAAWRFARSNSRRIS